MFSIDSCLALINHIVTPTIFLVTGIRHNLFICICVHSTYSCSWMKVKITNSSKEWHDSYIIFLWMRFFFFWHFIVFSPILSKQKYVEDIMYISTLSTSGENSYKIRISRFKLLRYTTYNHLKYRKVPASQDSLLLAYMFSSYDQSADW